MRFHRHTSKQHTAVLSYCCLKPLSPSGVPTNFFWGGVQRNQLRREGRESGDLGAVAPLSRVSFNLQMSGTRILIRVLRMYIPRNWEFGSAFSKLRNFGGGGVNSPTPPRYATALTVVGNYPNIRRVNFIITSVRDSTVCQFASNLATSHNCAVGYVHRPGSD
jgi:hypothetical protein